MTDVLRNLPEAREPLSREEMNMMKDIFRAPGSGLKTPDTVYKALIYGALFFALSLPITDKFIKGFIEATDIILLAVKTAIFIIIVFLLTSFGL